MAELCRKNARPPVGCVIMASGLARRFGSNKLLYEIGGVPMYLRTLYKLQKAASELGNCEIIVVTQYEEIAAKAQESVALDRYQR